MRHFMLNLLSLACQPLQGSCKVLMVSGFQSLHGARIGPAFSSLTTPDCLTWDRLTGVPTSASDNSSVTFSRDTFKSKFLAEFERAYFALCLEQESATIFYEGPEPDGCYFLVLLLLLLQPLSTRTNPFLVHRLFKLSHSLTKSGLEPNILKCI